MKNLLKNKYWLTLIILAILFLIFTGLSYLSPVFIYLALLCFSAVFFTAGVHTHKGYRKIKQKLQRKISEETDNNKKRLLKAKNLLPLKIQFICFYLMGIALLYIVIKELTVGYVI